MVKDIHNSSNEIVTQSLSINGSILRLHPLYNTPEFLKIWVNVWSLEGNSRRDGARRAALSGEAAMGDGEASFDIAQLKAGTYICGFFAYTQEHAEEVYLYENIFSWDGRQGFFNTPAAHRHIFGLESADDGAMKGYLKSTEAGIK
jgi:hypothetical protein